jgi:hypothetical protein
VNRARRFTPLGLAVAVVLLGLTGAKASLSDRPATGKQATAIRHELVIHLRAQAADPDSLIRIGTRFVIYPVCVSTLDNRFGSVWAWPLIGARTVSDPGLLFVGRAGGAWRPIGGFQLAEQIGDRPRGLPRDVRRDLMDGGQCVSDSREVTRRLKAGTLRVYRV